MADYNIQQKVLNSGGAYDNLYPKSKASLVDIADTAGHFSSTDVEGALAETAELISTKAAKAVYTATISTSWSGTSAPYTQSVSISGITANDNPHITPVYSTTNATAILQKTAWGLIGKGITGTNTITFTCFGDKPTTAVPIQVEVVR